MFLWLLFLFIVVPLAEIWVIGQVWGAIGGIETVLLLLVVSVLGAMLVKQQGVSVLDRIQRRLESGSMPTDELIDGGLILFAGALMLTPGFITDTVGVLLLLPPSRAVLRSVVGRRFRHRIEAATVSGASAGFNRGVGFGPGVDFTSWSTSSASGTGSRRPSADGTIDLDDDAIVEDRLVDEPGDEGPPRIDRP
ncbi:MAG: FxsA family protein [Acidimicrobiales bacterium]